MFRVARVPLEPTSVQAFLLSSVSVVFETDFQSTSRMSCALTLRINGMHQLITRYRPETARLRVFLRQNHLPNLRNERAPELHGILVIHRQINVLEWEQEVVGPLVDQLLQRGAEEGLTTCMMLIENLPRKQRRRWIARMPALRSVPRELWRP